MGQETRGDRMRCADYIVDTLVAHGITEAFVVVGGASMFLTDALSRHPDMRVTYMGHETACGGRREYFRLTGKMAVVCVSSGPGSWQAAVGVWGAWVDGQAMVVLAGQCKRSTINMDRLRQLGDQEADMAFMHLYSPRVASASPTQGWFQRCWDSRWRKRPMDALGPFGWRFRLTFRGRRSQHHSRVPITSQPHPSWIWLRCASAWNAFTPPPVR